MKQELILNYCKQFKLSGIACHIETVLQEAQSSQMSYSDCIIKLFEKEAQTRETKAFERRISAAKLPGNHKLDQYDHSFENGINKTRLNQLRELNWLDQIFNIVLMGSSGVGKTYVAAGLCFDAIKAGYKAYFRTMEDITNMLKLKDITKSAMTEYRRLSKANLIVMDDIMLFPLDKPVAIALFNFINQQYEKTAFIITTNKSPKEWAHMLNDEVLATALLDRILYRCEVINLSGKSYRIKNRKTIFN
ncbi:IS21-like element helper ATPase IstB [Saccharicrinis sp. 156]|uniref:IS21-like element helper ATPase IstB n=1 Tax=Saccharicrinis sp. 156 TaxID=3417574 RepID=UPI003D335756